MQKKTYQNSPSCCDRDASNSRSRSLNAFHSQLLSDQAPFQIPPYSLPAHGLRSLTKFVSWGALIPFCESIADCVVRTRAKPVTQYGWSDNRPERRCFVPFSYFTKSRIFNLEKGVSSSYFPLEIILILLGPNMNLGKLTEIVSISTYGSRNR